MTQGNITKAVFNLTGDNPLVRLTIGGKSYTTFASQPSLAAFQLLCQYNDPLRNPLVGGWIDFEHIQKNNARGGEPWLNITSINDLKVTTAKPSQEVVEESEVDRVLGKEEATTAPNPYEYYDSMEPPPVYLNADRYIGANIAYDQWHIDQRDAMRLAKEIGGRDIFDTFYRILTAYRGGDPRADGYTIGIEVPDVASGLNPVTPEETKDEETTKA